MKIKWLIYILLLTVQSGLFAQSVEHKKLFDEIVQNFQGEFDNFQQVWQENTKDDKHKVETSIGHQHIHSIFTFHPAQNDEPAFFEVVHQEGRGQKEILERYIFSLYIDEVKRTVLSKQYVFEPNDVIPKNWSDREAIGAWKWSRQSDGFIGSDAAGKTLFQLNRDTLKIAATEGVFKTSPETPYQMMRCRLFSGWIQYPIPAIADSTYFLRNLQIHDQGGMVQLVLDEKEKLDYSVELTQLVYGKRIAIMKLAIYDIPPEEVDFNSKSISYTWTDPTAKRIGINLRKIASGWTFIEPSSNFGVFSFEFGIWCLEFGI